MLVKDDTHLIPEYIEWENKINEKIPPHPADTDFEDLFGRIATSSYSVEMVPKDRLNKKSYMIFRTHYFMPFLVAIIVRITSREIEVRWKNLPEAQMVQRQYSEKLEVTDIPIKSDGFVTTPQEPS